MRPGRACVLGACLLALTSGVGAQIAEPWIGGEPAAGVASAQLGILTAGEPTTSSIWTFQIAEIMGDDEAPATLVAQNEVPGTSTSTSPAKVPTPLQIPQHEPLTYPVAPADPAQIEPPTPLMPRESVAVPDRWRIMETLGLKDDPLDPYHQNTLKGDKPLEALSDLGPDWFLALSAISDSTYSMSRIPLPVSSAGAGENGTYSVFGKPNLVGFDQNFIFSASIIEGDTSFRPPDYQIQITPAFNFNYLRAQERGIVNVNPENGLTRTDGFATLQEAFIDKHLRDVSDNYDFDSIRFGIQPFNADFRGFLFEDSAFGVRLFGTRDSNLWQYNIAWLRRIEKDTNSGLNDLGAGLRRDDSFIANVYRQDFPVPGHTTEFVILHNVNGEDDAPFYDSNGFLQRPAPVGDGLPHHYSVTYVGLNGDGHFGRWNLTSSIYGAFGEDSHNPIAEQPETIRAGFAALELSRDFDWVRVRASGVYATGDNNPYGGIASGFDAVRENPDIAGSDTSFWIRQAIPLIGGGGVVLSGSNALLPSLRTSEDQGQSNFVNPGLSLVGIGADFDVLPELRVLTNVSKLEFASTAVLEVLRNQGSISRDIGTDISAALQWRPLLSQNLVISASLAVLAAGRGFKQLYDADHIGLPYSFLLGVTARY